MNKCDLVLNWVTVSYLPRSSGKESDFMQPMHFSRTTVCPTRFQANRRHFFTNARLLKSSVYGSTLMRSPQALRGVPLSKVAVIPNTSVVLHVRICCQQNKSVRKKVLSRDSTLSFDALGIDCQLPGILRSACIVLLSFIRKALSELGRGFFDKTCRR